MFSITKASSAVSISNVPAGAAVDGRFTPAYTATGDGTPSITSQTPSTCTVSGGVVSFVAAGTCTLQAHLSEGTNFLAATGAPQSLTVARRGSTTTLSSSANPATVGQAITLTATVSPGTATGTVTFKDGTTVLTTIPLSEGTARFTTSTLMQGTHRITAVYNGNSTYAGSTSAVLSQVINRR